MTAAQMAAVAAVATPETPEERVVRVRAASSVGEALARLTPAEVPHATAAA